MSTHTSPDTTRGVPSGNRENMTGPDEGRSPENRLHDASLADRGEFIEDHQRDRDSNGLAGGQDDSLARRRGGDSDRYGVSRGD
ncbi:hypothetical protein [Lysobacter humi (ex Lee et al. 2017)]